MTASPGVIRAAAINRFGNTLIRLAGDERSGDAATSRCGAVLVSPLSRCSEVAREPNRPPRPREPVCNETPTARYRKRWGGGRRGPTWSCAISEVTKTLAERQPAAAPPLSSQASRYTWLLNRLLAAVRITRGAAGIVSTARASVFPRKRRGRVAAAATPPHAARTAC